MKQRLADTISLIARSPGLDPAAVDIVVTTPTFRRPEHLVRTLDSIAAQQTARRFAMVVMENEAERQEGAKAVAPLFESGRYRGLLIVAQERGNCHAYNAGWFTALLQFPAMRRLLVIDDDEVAGPDWLERMVATSERFDADFVGGPQRPVFEAGAQDRWKDHPVFRPHYDRTGPVPILYSSGNLLLRREVLERAGHPYMDLAFNFMGGGDADLMERSRRAGFTFAWCEEAPVFETVPAGRVSPDWIRKRALRNGVISALIQKRALGPGAMARARVAAKSLALLAASPIRTARLLAKGEPLLNALNPVHVALGRIGSEFGYANEQYRSPKD